MTASRQTPVALADDWSRALVLMPHPDDPETAAAAAVAKWTSSGRTVSYVLASRGEAGIDTMPAERAGPLREAEQRRAAAIVGVHDVEFWDEPDGRILNTAALRRRITETIEQRQPDMIVTIYGETHWAAGIPNHPDHIEFAAAVEQAYDDLRHPPRWLLASALQGSHYEAVDDFVALAVESLAAHAAYFSAIDPGTPVAEQAYRQLERTNPRRDDLGGRRVASFIMVREHTAGGG